MEIKLLSCPLCSVEHFENVIILRSTLIDVTKKPLSCPVCEEVLLGLDKFTIHLFTHTDLIDSGSKSEVITNEIVSSNDTNNNNNEGTCCNGSNSMQANCSQYQLHNQIEIIHGTINKESHCEICNFQFADATMLEMHRNLLHGDGFSCHLCHKKFKMHGSLMVHMRVAHYGFKNKIVITKGIEDKKEDTSQTPPLTNSPGTTVKNYENKQWECDVCLKRFTTKYFLKKHKRLHTGEMPYECTLCNKSFTFQQSYHKHMLYHSTDKPHTCSECGRAFKELSTLHNHQRIHSGERPFGCETCGKQFRQRVSYLVHRRIHTGAMPYKCTACDKSFRYKVSQRTHKCKAQPPGSVVRQFGDLVQKLLQNRTPEKPEIQVPEVVSEEEIEPEKTPEANPLDVTTDFFGLVMSPTFQITSDQFESLCLTNKVPENTNDEIFNNLRSDMLSSTSTPQEETNHECSTINEECFKQLLYHSNDMTLNN